MGRNTRSLSLPVIFAVFTCALLQTARADDQLTDVRLRDVAARATGDDEAASKQAIAQLRAAGPLGLQAIIDTNLDAVKRHRDGMNTSIDRDAWPRIALAIDTVAAQKDAWASGLYWYTDFEAAKKAAKDSGKPILSLRMLGTLDSDYSCANSRFFRTVLYADANVSKFLSDHFILHWKSVRPVPKVTIDFGDGRIVQRTITGNSIHYVLDADGQVIDGIPGLYGPAAFLRELQEAGTVAHQGSMGPGARYRQRWHIQKNNQILLEWQTDLQRVNALADGTSLIEAPQPRATLVQRAAPRNPPPAAAAARLAVGKGVVETRLVVALSPNSKAVESASKDEVWDEIATLHAEDARLDSVSRAVMLSKNPTALDAGRRALAKSVVENPLVKIVDNFQRSIAIDTVRNEYTFHRQIHAWLANGTLSDGKSANDVDALNERVYADLFLTPSSDPWLGLLPPDTYSALPDDGMCLTK